MTTAQTSLVSGVALVLMLTGCTTAPTSATTQVATTAVPPPTTSLLSTAPDTSSPTSPPTSSLTSPPLTAALTERWSQHGVGMSDAFLASSGRIVLADAERVYIADGFGWSGPGDRVTAFDAAAGGLLWQRDDAGGPDEDPFLQTLAGDLLLVAGQYHTVSALGAATGETVWTLSLPHRYGAVGATVLDDTVFIATNAPSEGDIRPPVVHALSLTDGGVRWETALSPGTDLQWSPLAVSSELLVVSTTLSHPGSASGNLVHGLDPETGELLWTADLGGEQGFSFHPILITEPAVVVYTPPSTTVGLDRTTGAELWRITETNPLTAAGDGRFHALQDLAIVVIDAADLTVTPVVTPAQLGGLPVAGAELRAGVIVLFGWNGAQAHDTETGELLWEWRDSEVHGVAMGSDDYLAVATADRTIRRIDLP